MSSILEALRELEASKGPAAPGTSAWTEEYGRSRSALETLGIVAGGLALGGAAFALVIWLAGSAFRDPPEPPGGAAPVIGASPGIGAPPAAPSPQASEPAAGPAAPPAWLGRAEPPRARVTPGASPSERMPSMSRAAPAPAPGAASPASDDSIVVVSAISYSPDSRRRSVTMRVGGTLATLREGQSMRGVEVQLILRDSVYVRRGGEVVVLEPER